MSGTLFIVSAPSGAGKSSLLQALLRKHDDASMKISVSTTTRAPRPGEEDGVHYHFVSTDEFKNQIAAGDFYEWAQVFDNYYGTSKRVIEQQLAQGIDVFLDIDWQGARQIREQVPSAKSIFILPPSVAELHNRLTGRGQDSVEVIAKRMLQAKSEMSHYDEYDYLIINDNFDQALNELNCIVYAQRQALTHQQQRFGDLIADLLA